VTISTDSRIGERQQYQREIANEEAQRTWNYRWSRFVDGSAYLNSAVAQERGGVIRQ